MISKNSKVTDTDRGISVNPSASKFELSAEWKMDLRARSPLKQTN
jgi:hypothetical protein